MFDETTLLSYSINSQFFVLLLFLLSPPQLSPEHCVAKPIFSVRTARSNRRSIRTATQHDYSIEVSTPRHWPTFGARHSPTFGVRHWPRFGPRHCFRFSPRHWPRFGVRHWPRFDSKHWPRFGARHCPIFAATLVCVCLFHCGRPVRCGCARNDQIKARCPAFRCPHQHEFDMFLLQC